ncbi:biliverdin-producing heme oxygenase [Aurantimonas endophytica]|uniref:Heme oxygenase n=1 Tax=Aurantimonas endophytica TaxID=1522175 RepID=A0A7W6HCS5_9HYPH|nr:biliverdin-producing heme oxygenase [Aurantimonas endophytica]MBB4002799.1 heme oxygenase [Aurantimonas endophytica]MCO6403677.1 hypothetical protein [Aurantimonas endophytica]
MLPDTALKDLPYQGIPLDLMNDAASCPVANPGLASARAGAPLRALLRHATETPHQRLDSHFARMTEAPDASDYHRFIRMSHACHMAIEPVLAQMAQRLDDPLLARRQSLLPMLSQDMRAMGLAPVLMEPLALNRPDLPEAAGLIYVLDGSRLGARFIHREFITKDLTRRWPGITTAYLAGASGPDAFGERMTALSGRVISETARQRALAAAQTAFALFEAAFAWAARNPEAATS